MKNKHIRELEKAIKKSTICPNEDCEKKWLAGLLAIEKKVNAKIGR